MTYEIVLKKIIDILAQVLDDEDIEITSESNLLQDLELDSLEISSVFGELEKVYGLKLSDELLRSMVKVHDIADAAMKAAKA